MIDYVSLYNNSKEYYSKLHNKLKYSEYERVVEGKKDIVFKKVDSLPTSLIFWIKYFLGLECNDTCINVVNLYFSNEKRTIKDISEELGIAPCTISAKLKDAYRVVNFCDTFFQGIDYCQLADRVSLKMYDKIFMIELLARVESKIIRNSYVNALARVGVLTLEDLLSKDIDTLLSARRISDNTLVMLSERLQELGVTEFIFESKDTSVSSLDYSSQIMQAGSKEEAIEILLQYVESKGLVKVAGAFRDTWCKE